MKEISIKEVSVFEEQANALVIKTSEDLTHAVKMLSETNKVSDRVKAEKEKVTAPLNEALKAERARWKPIEDACMNAVSTIKSKMQTFQKALDAENAKKEAQLLARAEKGTMKIETVVNKLAQLPDTSASVSTDAGAIQWRTVKKLVIDDVSLIPREYMVVNEMAVKEALKAGKAVPGARFIEEKTVSNFR